MSFQKIDIEALLRRHCEISPLELCVMHWIPESKSLDWYLGFLQCAEIHKGIRGLFAENIQPEAYEALATRIRSELSKLVAKESE